MNEIEEYIFEVRLSKFLKIQEKSKKLRFPGKNKFFINRSDIQMTGDVVAIKILTIFEFDEIDDIIVELKGKQGKMSEYEAILHDVFCYSGNLFLVLEYFEYGSLLDLIMNRKRLEERECWALVAEVLKFMDFFHGKDFFGLNVQPSQLFVDNSGRVKAFTFASSGLFRKGLAKCKNNFTGSPYYMAPEVIKGGKKSKESDVWSFGITILELVTGQLPYRKYSKTKALFEIVNKPAPVLSKKFSKKLRNFVDKCLQKEPSKRLKVKDLMEEMLVSSSQSRIFVSEFLFEEKDTASIESCTNGKSAISRNSDSIYFSGQSADKGSLISTKFLEEMMNQQTGRDKGGNQQDHFLLNNGAFFGHMKRRKKPTHSNDRKESLGEELATVNPKSLLKLKRAIRKVDKLKPGLSHKIFQEIVEKYQNTVKSLKNVKAKVTIV